jgi:cystathionine beta-lyase/cystathionine gamma-synthase
MSLEGPRPHISPLVLSSVWECRSTEEADAILSRASEGYVYRREGHPNAQELAQVCNHSHGVAHGTATASGMSAIAAALLAIVQQGDHVLLSDRLYGKTTHLVASELKRLGIQYDAVDMRDLAATQQAIQSHTKMLIVETIANPLLEVFDIAALSNLAHAAGAKVLVDNTFATPFLCRPAALGADLVMESLTKMLNGHSDVLLGWLGTNDAALGARMANVVATYGFCSHPLDAWLATRSSQTFPLRMERACSNALRAAAYLESSSQVEHVAYPGLSTHPQHALAQRQFSSHFGSLVTFRLRGGRAAVNAFIERSGIPFCPSLGTTHTSLSHPASTSHRGLSQENREQAGIFEGTVRLSAGIEEVSELLDKLRRGLESSNAGNAM